MKVFIDTSAFIALFIKTEIDHDAVVEKYQHYQQERAICFSSDYVFSECYTRLIYDIGPGKAVKIIQSLEESRKQKEIEILRVDEEIFEKAFGVFLKFSEHKISFTDATSYVLFQSFAFDEIFTLDTDFKKLRLPVSFPQLK